MAYFFPASFHATHVRYGVRRFAGWNNFFANPALPEGSQSGMTAHLKESSVFDKKRITLIGHGKKGVL
jgi:hypothetical protein